jgi:hypothetical protein
VSILETEDPPSTITRRSSTGSTSLWRRVLVLLAVIVAGLGGVAVTASPAAASDSGSSRCLWIRASGGAINYQHWPNDCPFGTYHVHFWHAGGSWSHNTGTHRYSGTYVNLIVRVPVPVPAGGTVCGELWYHQPGGGYGSYGLPCVTMS